MGFLENSCHLWQGGRGGSCIFLRRGCTTKELCNRLVRRPFDGLLTDDLKSGKKEYEEKGF